jgi:calcineurin-like phosphoesterase family protein
MEKVWVTSDHHFNHTNIIKYCERPFCDVQQMNEQMIEKWNSVVDKNDIVLHLGDFILGYNYGEKIGSILDKLNGEIYLIIGNHDNAVIDGIKRRGFNAMNNFIIDNMFFCHYPIVQGISTENRDRLRSNQKFHESKCEFVVHGHVHSNSFPNYNKHFNVSVDRNDFNPIDLESIRRYFEGENESKQ